MGFEAMMRAKGIQKGKRGSPFTVPVQPQEDWKIEDLTERGMLDRNRGKEAPTGMR